MLLGPPNAQTQRYDIGTPERGRQGRPQQGDVCAQENEERRDLFKEDSHNDWDSDGLSLAEHEAIVLANAAGELEGSMPGSHSQPTPPTSSTSRPTCVQGHLVRPSSQHSQTSCSKTLNHITKSSCPRNLTVQDVISGRTPPRSAQT